MRIQPYLPVSAPPINIIIIANGEEAHHPDVGRDVEDLSAGGEERHALARDALLIGLVAEVRAMPDHLAHSSKRLGVVLKGLLERRGERLVCDICSTGMDSVREREPNVEEGRGSGGSHRRVWARSRTW